MSAAEHYRLGLEAFKKGYLNVAFTHFSATVEKNPNSADALYHTGLIYTKMENFDLAERYYNMALGADTSHVGAKKALGLDDDESSNSPKNITETDFFKKLKAEGSAESAEFLQTLEKMDFKLDLEAQSHRLEYALQFIVATLKMLIPAALAGFFVGMGLSAMGFGSFLWSALISGSIIFLVQIIEKFK